MKKVTFVLAVLLLSAFISAGHAQTRPGAASITPFIGGYIFDGDEDFKDPLVYGIRIGNDVTKNWGFETAIYYGDTERQSLAGNPDVNLLGYGVDVLYHFMPEGKLVPFLAAGIGGRLVDGPGGSNRLALDYGAGLKYFLTESIALRADVRHVMPFNERKDNLLYSFGINFLFGGVKEKPAEARAAAPAAAPAAVLDSDNDGVPNKADKCPMTPAGVKVDKYGCPLDSDNDGVPDYLDKCPDTPANVTSSQVDKDGCPIDSDNDGVPDYLDKCPGTPKGMAVDQEGCTIAALVAPQAAAPAPAAKTPMEKAIEEKGRVTLKVYFDFDKAVIKNQYHNEIGNLAEVMRKNPEIKILIEGHTDSVGDAKYNEGLSQRRADAVRKYLIEKFGIADSRLTAKGFGESRPIASNSTKEGRAKNRRVEAAADYIKIIKK